MTAAVVRTATESDHRLLPAYLEHVAALGLSDRALRGRLCAARALLAEAPDLSVWMTLPISERLAALERTRAWPLLVFAIGTGRLRLDLELMTGKHLTGLGRIVHDQQRKASPLRARPGCGWAGRRAGSPPVRHEGLAVLIAWRGGDLDDLDDAVLQEFTVALTASSALPPSSLRAYRTRLASLRRQILFELQIIDVVPRRGSRGASYDDRFAAVAMAEQIRASLLRYVTLRSAVLRPKSVESLINDLLPFAEFLHHQHPELTGLAQLERRHVEAFLLHNRSRLWQGWRARGKGAGGSARPDCASACSPQPSTPASPAPAAHR